MLDRCPTKPRLVLATATLLLGTLPAVDAGGVTGCQQPTPSPCAADGICRPNLEWGFSRTRWRSWPGDAVGDTPSEDDAAPEDDELLLEPMELPKLEEEELRGPAKKKIPAADSAAAEDPSQPLPEDEGLPEQDEIDFPAVELEGAQIDRQGNGQMRPAHDGDGPPELPASLREVASHQHQPLHGRFSEQTRDPQIVPAKADQSTGIRLINPAAVTTRGTAGNLSRVTIRDSSTSRRGAGTRVAASTR